MKYTTIVGMEIHVELKTTSKMFCGCKNDPFHAPKPNMYTCPVCLGMPGGLPVPNKKAIEWTIMLAQALHCQIAAISKFDRKNYFYPDLAKGYQISQYDQPIGEHGQITIRTVDTPGTVQEKTIRIRRVHLEEDTGKLQHATIDGKKVSLVDFNRSGVPLVEIVTEADIRSGEEAKAFLKELHKIVRYLGISDANMEQGSMRLEPNISVKQATTDSEDGLIDEKDFPPYKVEVKNINSFNYVKKAIEYETKRHIELLEQGELPQQETRGWNEHKNETFSQRRKENANDYRYFPDPDIPPLRFSSTMLEKIRNSIDELPQEKSQRFVATYRISVPQAEFLTEDLAMTEYIEDVWKQAGSRLTPTVIANWIINKKIAAQSVSPDELIQAIITATTVEEISDETIQQAIGKVLSEQPKAVSDYKSGKTGVMMFLLGMTIKELKGKGDKSKIQEQLASSLRV
jgi:aspartyl-tRNA(Asn)/glutamyl-tRNA(Gln) amidotransferase subunit B